MPIPENIEKQGQEAERLIQEHVQGSRPGHIAPELPEPVETIEPSAPPLQEAPLQPGQDNIPTEPVQVIDPPAPQEDFQAKYNEAMEQYQFANSQLVEVQNQSFALHNQILALQKEIADLKAQPVTQQVDSQQTNLDPESFATYGADFVDVVNEVNDLKRQLLEAKKQTADVQTPQSDRVAYIDSLNQTIPDFALINNDPAFLNWLTLANPYTGEPRNKTFQEADQNMNTAVIQAIFREFANSGLFISPSAPTHQPMEPMQQTVAPPELSVSPAPSLDANYMPPAQGKLYTKAQVNQFFTDMANGKFRGNEAWANEQQADIIKAGPENRIR